MGTPSPTARTQFSMYAGYTRRYVSFAGKVVAAAVTSDTSRAVSMQVGEDPGVTIGVGQDPGLSIQVGEDPGLNIGV